jgi:hypothetical protein
MPLHFTPQDRADALDLFMKGNACEHCGGVHRRACPRVRELEWNDKGQIRRVVYWADAEWQGAREFITWPEDCYEEDEDDE